MHGELWLLTGGKCCTSNRARDESEVPVSVQQHVHTRVGQRLRERRRYRDVDDRRWTRASGGMSSVLKVASSPACLAMACTAGPSGTSVNVIEMVTLQRTCLAVIPGRPSISRWITLKNVGAAPADSSGDDAGAGSRRTLESCATSDPGG